MPLPTAVYEESLSSGLKLEIDGYGNYVRAVEKEIQTAAGDGLATPISPQEATPSHDRGEKGNMTIEKVAPRSGISCQRNGGRYTIGDSWIDWIKTGMPIVE